MDFEIYEPTAFSGKWFSHKSNGPAVRYEIAISIVGGDICWTNGPFPAGKYPDITIFRRGLMKKLDPGEFVEADHGYDGEMDKIRLPYETDNKGEISRKGRARARHEGMNAFIKNFKALSDTWRHPVEGGQHKVAFDAAVTITQIGIDLGKIKPFKCQAPYKKK